MPAAWFANDAASTIDAPDYGDEDGDSVNQCDVCHSGLVFTELP